MRKHFLTLSTTLLCTTFSLCGAAQAGSYTFKSLKIPGQDNSAAVAVTEDNVVVGSVLKGGGDHGLIWAKGKYTVVDVPGQGSIEFTAVNAKGIVAGRYSDVDTGTDQVFTYDLATGAETLAATSPDYTLYPNGINRTGRIVGFALKNQRNLSRGFSTTSMSNKLLRPNSLATGIDDAAEIVGFFTDGKEYGHGFLFHAGTYSLLDVPGASLTYPEFVTPTGVIGGRAIIAGIQRGFTLASGLYSTYSFPGAPSTSVTGVSSNGEVVGEYLHTDGSIHGFVFLNATYFPIDAPGAAFTEIFGVNAKGTLVGRQTFNDNTAVAYVAECPVNQRPCTQ